MKHDLDVMRDDFVNSRSDYLVRMSYVGNGYGDTKPTGTWLRITPGVTEAI